MATVMNDNKTDAVTNEPLTTFASILGDFAQDTEWVFGFRLAAVDLHWRYVEIYLAMKRILKLHKNSLREENEGSRLVINSENFQTKLQGVMNDLIRIRAKGTKRRSDCDNLSKEIDKISDPAERVLEDMCTLIAQLTGKSEEACMDKIYSKARDHMYPHLKKPS